MTTLHSLLSGCLLLAVITPAAAGTVYKCTSAAGAVTYQDAPCPRTQQQQAIHLVDTQPAQPAPQLQEAAPDAAEAAPPAPAQPVPSAPLPVLYSCQRATDGKIYLVYRPASFLDKNLPQSNLSSARATAAWGCAIDGGVAEKFHNVVFSNQPATEGDGYTDAQITAFAKSAGITGDALTTFNSCVTAKTYNQWVTNSATAFKDSGVPGTHTAYLNGTEVKSATLQDMAALEKLIASTPAS